MHQSSVSSLDSACCNNNYRTTQSEDELSYAISTPTTTTTGLPLLTVPQAGHDNCDDDVKRLSALLLNDSMTDMYSYTGREQEERGRWETRLVSSVTNIGSLLLSIDIHPQQDMRTPLGGCLRSHFIHPQKLVILTPPPTLSAPRHQYDVTAAALCWKALLWVGGTRE